MARPPDLGRAVSGGSTGSDYVFEDDEDDDVEPCGLDRCPSGEAREGARRRAQVIWKSLEQLRREQERRVGEAVECTGLPDDDAFLLLRRHGWDTAAFEEAFFEAPEAARRGAGVSDPEELGGRREMGLCAICFCDPGIPLLPCELRQVQAGPASRRRAEPHPLYCRACWQQYVEHAVCEGKSCLELRCPTPGCSEAVRPSHVAELLAGNRAMLERYQRFCAQSLVDDSRGRARWCPGQGCGCAAAEPAAGVREVECPCGTKWCFGCGTDSHLPVSCETVQRWEEKNRDEGEDATWIRVNTKLCPKCANPIEKNGGCMHMTCYKPGGCGHEFCWICMKDWRNHQTCNATPESSAEAEAKSSSKSALLRYGHFYERYMAHHKAQNFSATTQLDFIGAIAEALIRTHDFQEKHIEFLAEEKHIEFLAEAVREIRDCRRFLKWTYAHAYFTNYAKQQKVLFEFHQGQLESTVDRLSDIMENTNWDSFLNTEAESFRPFYDLRQQLVSLTDVVHKFFAHLREAIEQGTLLTGG